MLIRRSSRHDLMAVGVMIYARERSVIGRTQNGDEELIVLDLDGAPAAAPPARDERTPTACSWVRDALIHWRLIGERPAAARRRSFFGARARWARRGDWCAVVNRETARLIQIRRKMSITAFQKTSL